jgi:methyl-accepting chemotaxis protein
MQFQERKQYLVDRTLQYAAAATALFLVVLALCLHTAISYFRLEAALASANDRAALPGVLIGDLAISLVLAAALVTTAAVVGSHRVAGPLSRLQRALRSAQSGDLTELVHLRRGDFLHEFAADLNLALGRLRDAAAEDRARVEEARRLLGLARASGDLPDAQKHLERAAAELARVGSKLRLEQGFGHGRGTTGSAGCSEAEAASPVPLAEERAGPS